jgi:UDP-3-O-[3-hydroxymyristoyl] glucosamine N-acyltransferase
MRLRELAQELKAEVHGEGDWEIKTLSPLSSAGNDSLTFFTNPKYKDAAKKSRAGAILCSSKEGLEDRNLLIHKNPYAAWARALELFFPKKTFPPEIHKTAIIGEGSAVSDRAFIGPYVVIGKNSVVEEGAVVEAASIIGDNCAIRAQAHIFPRVVLYDGVEIGRRSILHSGVVAGSDGFGYAEDDGRIRKVPQIGKVVIESDVEIGANTTIDRGALEQTLIGEGSKIDNLCQIAHNVRVGRSCAIIAQSGISGSTELGNGVMMSGQSGAVGHIRIGDFAKIGAKSAVTRNVPDRTHYTGIPAREHKKWLKELAIIQKMEKIYEILKTKGFLKEEKKDD